MLRWSFMGGGEHGDFGGLACVPGSFCNVKLRNECSTCKLILAYHFGGLVVRNNYRRPWLLRHSWSWRETFWERRLSFWWFFVYCAKFWSRLFRFGLFGLIVVKPKLKYVDCFISGISFFSVLLLRSPTCSRYYRTSETTYTGDGFLLPCWENENETK